jgi:hypothetical protein
MADPAIVGEDGQLTEAAIATINSKQDTDEYRIVGGRSADGKVTYTVEFTDSRGVSRTVDVSTDTLGGSNKKGFRNQVEKANNAYSNAYDANPDIDPASISYDGKEVTVDDPEFGTYTYRAGTGESQRKVEKRAERARERSVGSSALDESIERTRSAQDYLDLGGFLPTAEDLSYDPTLQGRSELAQAKADPESIKAQRQVLRQLQDVYAQEGMTEADRAAMELASRRVGAQVSAERAAALEQLSQQGMLGGGAQLTARLGAAQTGANALADFNAQNTIAARQRALSALQQSGELAGQVRGQSFGEAATRGQASDVVRGSDVDRLNEAARARAEAEQTAFGNRMALGTAQAGTSLGQAGQFGETMQFLKQMEENRLARQKAQKAQRQATGTGLLSGGMNILGGVATSAVSTKEK